MIHNRHVNLSREISTVSSLLLSPSVLAFHLSRNKSSEHRQRINTKQVPHQFRGEDPPMLAGCWPRAASPESWRDSTAGIPVSAYRATRSINVTTPGYAIISSAMPNPYSPFRQLHLARRLGCRSQVDQENAMGPTGCICLFFTLYVKPTIGLVVSCAPCQGSAVDVLTNRLLRTTLLGNITAGGGKSVGND